MHTGIFKIIAVLIACGGLVLSIFETQILIFIGCLACGAIIYELAEIIDNKRK